MSYQSDYTDFTRDEPQEGGGRLPPAPVGWGAFRITAGTVRQAKQGPWVGWSFTLEGLGELAGTGAELLCTVVASYPRDNSPQAAEQNRRGLERGRGQVRRIIDIAGISPRGVAPDMLIGVTIGALIEHKIEHYQGDEITRAEVRAICDAETVALKLGGDLRATGPTSNRPAQPHRDPQPSSTQGQARQPEPSQPYLGDPRPAQGGYADRYGPGRGQQGPTDSYGRERGQGGPRAVGDVMQRPTAGQRPPQYHGASAPLEEDDMPF